MAVPETEEDSVQAQTLPRELMPAELCRRSEPTALAFETTDELADVGQVPGQERALSAIEFGVGIEHEGYNLFAMGPEGLGGHAIVLRHLEQRAAGRATPSDWCYVYDFETQRKPRALELPAGSALKFRRDMAHLVEDLQAGIPAAFESDEYRARSREIETEFGERQEQAIGAMGERAKAQGIVLLRTPAGFGFAPSQGDEVMSPAEFRKLPEEEQKRLERVITRLQEELEQAVRDMPKWRREAQRKLRELNRQIVRVAVNGLIEDLRAEYEALPQVRDYLTAVREDVIDRAELFHQPKEGEQPTLFGVPLSLADSAEPPLRRYQVNVLVEHVQASGVPIVYEDNPTHDNLVGRIEHVSQMGALLTDFTLIKAGALHRANGGYLILDALKLLLQPLSWDALKRALRSREIRVESLGQAMSLVSTVSLDPVPIPLDVKIVLIGDRRLYYLLHASDPEFAELFKVAVDFDEDMKREPESERTYARLIASLARSEKLRALDRQAVARVIEHGAREAGDAERLSMRTRDILDLLRESDHLAGAAGRAVIGAGDVQGAVDSRIARADRIRNRMQDDMVNGVQLIDTTGMRAGQINALSVIQLGEFSFGVPRRVTARVRLGSGRVVDIERESELGGPIHTKGVMILSGFIAGRYAADRPLSLAASLVFEQSYGGVEGDSASSAELYALLSALAEAPIRQTLAVTGSVNQHGEIQAIGGANEKIEGFFDLCARRGLTGEQGVLVPASNVRYLMLRQDVVQAVADGRFHVYSVETVDQGIALLTGIEAGARSADGSFPEGTINARVERRLAAFAESARSFGSDRNNGRKRAKTKTPPKEAT